LNNWLKATTFILVHLYLYNINLYYWSLKLVLQSEKIDFLSSAKMIQFIKLNISQIRSDDKYFNDKQNESVEYCLKYDIVVPEIRKISSWIINFGENIQYFSTKIKWR